MHETIAIAGATGNLGPAIISALLSQTTHTITILTRTGTLTASIPSHPRLTIAHITSYTEHATLVPALRGHTVLLSLLPDHGAQPALFDAAMEAGVRRIVPSEFGVDVAGNIHVRALPVFRAGKAVTQTYLKAKAAEDKLSYVLICTGAFLDWGIETGFVATLPGSNEVVREGKCKIYDGGEYERSMTTLADIGRAVVGVLEKWEELRNGAVYVQSCAASQMELLRIAEAKGTRVEVEAVDLESLEKKCYQAVEGDGSEDQAKVEEAMFGFVTVGCWKRGMGTFWGERHDSELLGVKQMTRKELEEVVGRYV